MLTIFTPTYNRAYILPKLYESLCSQTKKVFEWIIIDDGSNDDTEDIVKKWIKNNHLFDIVYRKKENGGKHRAINDAVKMAQYDWFFIVDADDHLTSTAVERINEWIKTIEDDNSFAGVSGLRGYVSTDEIVGEYPNDKQYEHYIDATNLQREELRLAGDKAEVYKTAVLKQHPFPEFEGETFITEAVVWDEIARAGHKLRWFNKVIYRCEYLEDGLSMSGNKKFIDNFEGFVHYTRLQLSARTRGAKRRAIMQYFVISKEKGIKFYKAKSKLDISFLYACFSIVVSRIDSVVYVLKKEGVKGVIARIKNTA